MATGKQLSELNRLSLSNNKNYRLKQLLNWGCTKIQQSQKHYWEHFGIIDHEYRFYIQEIVAFLADIGYLVKPLSNH